MRKDPAPAMDTIVAISSPPGRSLRGLVRLSGPQAVRIVSRSLTTALPPTRMLGAGRLSLDSPACPDAGRASGVSAALPILLLHLPAPGSYTGQDIIELHCPGQPALLQRLVHRLIDQGARPAEPGEFTFRAYLAGKLDLTQAEGVAATISAQSDAQWLAASQWRQGKLGDLSRRLVDDLAEALAAVEAGIDFTDQEDVRPIDADALLARLDGLLASLRRTLTRSRDWAELDAPPRVVLVGLPSVGKSTLFNALLGRQRSVISALPGTTRDILAEPLTLPGTSAAQAMEVMLVDVAGLDQPRHALDRQMQAAARQAIAQADLLLAVGDDRHAPPGRASLPDVGDKPLLAVRTKADLPARRPITPGGELPVIAPQGQGLETLRQAMADRLHRQGRFGVQGQAMALGPRHQRSLHLACEHLSAAGDLLRSQADGRGVDQPELVACELRLALDELAALGGQMTPDDVIGKVFATFCVGK